MILLLSFVIFIIDYRVSNTAVFFIIIFGIFFINQVHADEFNGKIQMKNLHKSALPSTCVKYVQYMIKN